MTPEQIRDMRNRVRYGMPLTMEEQRWLTEQVTGPIPQRKRCNTCEGTGQFSTADEEVCRHCGGEGYIAVPPARRLSPTPPVYPLLTRDEAIEQHVCRICREVDAPRRLGDGPVKTTVLDPFVYDYGKEYAHASCLIDLGLRERSQSPLSL